MKKSLIVLAALAVLSGCGMNEKTTCTNENKVGNITSKVTYEIEHKNNDVKKVILTYDYRDDHTDGVGTGTDGTTKDKEDNNTTNNDNKNDNTTKAPTDNDGLIGGVTGEALDDIVTGAADGILDIAGIKRTHNNKISTYSSIKGVTTKVDVDNENDYKITYTYDLKQLSDSDITSLGINKDYTTLKNNYTSRGLTCK